MAGSVCALGGGPLFSLEGETDKKDSHPPFRIALNTSTISGYKLPVEQQIDLCAEAGFESIELWMRDVQDFMSRGGKPEALASRIENVGLQLDNMIGFAAWMTGEPGMDEMKKEMELSARLGSKYIAATCFGVERLLEDAKPFYSQKFRELIEFGDTMGVYPLLELWGHRALHRLSDIVSIALEAHHNKASLLLDFYHLYRGGNSFDSLSLINGRSLPVFHINDYPAMISRHNLKDTDRVFPGDGICPFDRVLPLLCEIGFNGSLSLELFNANYWNSMDVRSLLKTGYNKIKRLIDETLTQKK